jgi:hypothetical protein
MLVEHGYHRHSFNPICTCSELNVGGCMQPVVPVSADHREPVAGVLLQKKEEENFYISDRLKKKQS